MNGVKKYQQAYSIKTSLLLHMTKELQTGFQTILRIRHLLRKLHLTENQSQTSQKCWTHFKSKNCSIWTEIKDFRRIFLETISKFLIFLCFIMNNTEDNLDKI